MRARGGAWGGRVMGGGGWATARGFGGVATALGAAARGMERVGAGEAALGVTGM